MDVLLGDAKHLAQGHNTWVESKNWGPCRLQGVNTLLRPSALHTEVQRAGRGWQPRKKDPGLGPGPGAKLFSWWIPFLPTKPLNSGCCRIPVQ